MRELPKRMQVSTCRQGGAAEGLVAREGGAGHTLAVLLQAVPESLSHALETKDSR